MDYETWFKESPMNYELKPEIRSAYIYKTRWDGFGQYVWDASIDGMPLDYYGWW